MSANEVVHVPGFNVSCFDKLPEQVFLKSMTGEYLYVNDAVEKAYPKDCSTYLSQGIIENPFLNLYAKSDRIARETGSYAGVEPVLINGEVVNAWVRKVCLKDANGDEIGILVFSSPSDVTTQMRWSAEDAGSCVASRQCIKQLFFGMTEREAEVLYFLIRGDSMSAIADKLGLSATTIRSYLDNLKTRWQVSSRAELINKAILKSYAFITPERLSAETKR
jgi:DNA-binding CsgD family transcriptional regulator